jgi:hypothetical protein
MLRKRRRARSKIFIVSLHRAGTQSTHMLLERAGLKAIHWPAHHKGVDYQAMAVGHETDTGFLADMLAPVIRAYDVLSDVPICAIYESLAARHPDAVFIGLTRPAEDWARSIRRHTDTRPLDPYEKAMFWRYMPGRPKTLAEISDDALMDMHRRHNEGLQAFFAGSRCFKLLELYDPRAGEAMCEFLGLPPRPLGHYDYMSDAKPVLLRGGIRLARAALQMIGAGRSE